MTRPTLIDLNPIRLIYFPIMITLDKLMEVVMFLMTYLSKYVFGAKQKT